MKLYYLFSMLTLCQVATSWVLPQNVVKKAAAVGVATTITLSPIIAAHASETIPPSAKYSDPKHPGCKREVVISPQGKAQVSGADGTPGCIDSAKLKEFTVSGTVGSDGKSMVIDFSPKGGPKDIYAKWVGDGLVFTDGNKWTLKE